MKVVKNNTENVLDAKFFIKKIRLIVLSGSNPVRYKYVGRLLVIAVFARLGIIASFKDQKGKEAL
jgi:hypothetical protein